jgi:hypothetical protein
MTTPSKPSETESLPFVPNSEEEAAEAFGLAALLFSAIKKDMEENPDEEE